MADDDVIEKKSSSKWLWIAVIAVLALVAIMVFVNADGDDPDLPDSAVTTTEERLDTDLSDESELTTEAIDDVNGIDPVATVAPEGTEVEGDEEDAFVRGALRGPRAQACERRDALEQQQRREAE